MTVSWSTEITVDDRVNKIGSIRSTRTDDVAGTSIQGSIRGVQLDSTAALEASNAKMFSIVMKDLSAAESIETIKTQYENTYSNQLLNRE